jgi:ribonuclease Z
MENGITRRDVLKLSGLTLGGLAMGGTAVAGQAMTQPLDPTKRNDLIDSLPPFFPGKEPLSPIEMRITFLGTSCIPRLAQECNSIFVEVGGGKNGEALDQFIFDCGTGVVAKYNALGIPMRKMDKIFLTHLHGDHMSDLTHIYCFGPAQDRKSPLYIWGPGPSGLTDPVNSHVYNDDGLNMFCQKFRDMMRWHTESFSFGSTADNDYDPPTQADWGLPVKPVPVVPTIGPPDPTNENGYAVDGYSIVPIELDWTKKGDKDDNIAYQNAATGVTITHFPMIHCRKGSIGYKLKWKGLSMIFTGDSKPSYDIIDQASGVTVLIHEMVVPAEVWAAKNLGYRNPSEAYSDPNFQSALAYATAVQNSSHTPQGALGYILSQIQPPPKLAVATHFQATDDTIKSAFESIRNHYPNGDVTIAADLMVLTVTANKITKRKAVISDYAWYPMAKLYPHLAEPKYHDAQGNMDPTAQIDQTESIPPGKDDKGNPTYDPSGY